MVFGEIARNGYKISGSIWLGDPAVSSGEYTAEQLRTAAARHEEIARRYRELASLLDQEEPRVAKESAESVSSNMSKKNAVQQDLLLNGPSTAKEIHNRTGIPLATIYFVCQDSRTFKKKGLHWQAVKPRGSTSSGESERS